MSAGDEAADRTWALPVVAVLLLVVFPVAGAWGYHTFVLATGDTLEENVQAGATVEPNATAGTVTVTFTANQNADYLSVRVTEKESGLRVAENESALRVANTSADATVTDEGVRLPAVGSQVTYGEARPDENTTVNVVVVAVQGDVRSAILAKDVEL